MNTIGIALVWCVVQVTLIGLLAGGLYLLVRWLRPAAAAPVVLTGLLTVVVLSLLVLSPWPRWTIHDTSPLPLAAGQAARAEGGAQDDTAEQAADDSAGPLDAGPAARGRDAVSVGNRPSSLALLWQAFLNELAQPRATTPTSARYWPGVMAVLLLAAMACGLGWFMLGLAAVRWQRLRSRPVLDCELLELVDVLRAELGCYRPVEVRQADDLATAAMIGWRRPVLLLPADWGTWTAEQRRAVLAHEIVHARSHDFLVLLIGQLGLALHFYHPLLHWLIGRLRLEQELAADAAAASISGGQRQYLMAIAELALHQQDRPLLWPARTFLPTQTTFLRRITMLRDSQLRFDRLSAVARLATVGAVLLCGLLVAGLRGPGGQQQARAEDAVTPANNEPAPAAAEGTARHNSMTELSYDDGTPDGRRSMGGSGEMIQFSLPTDTGHIKGIRIHGSRYGLPQPPAEDFLIHVLSEDMSDILFTETAPYKLFERGKEKWVTVKFKKVQAVPKTFWIVLDFRAHQTKGVFVSYDTSTGGKHSKAGLPGGNKPSDVGFGGDWMIRVQLASSGAATATGVQADAVSSGTASKAIRKPIEPLAQAGETSKKAAAPNAIVAGVGWMAVRVGMKREDLIEALGKPDNDPSSDWLKWASKHIDCTFHPGSLVVSEVRFNPGFKGALNNGLKLGSPGREVLKLYGEPTHVTERGNLAKKYEYSQEGILFWTYQGRITQIVIFKPVSAPVGQAEATGDPPQIVSTSPADGAQEVDPATTEVTVTFDRDMGPSFTWNGDGPEFPFVPKSKPFWRDRRTCVLPVKLEAGHNYQLGLNTFSPNFEAFRSAGGVRALPKTIEFATRGTRQPDGNAEASKKRPEPPKVEPNSQVVVEGVGWEDFRLGATREELTKAYGDPDPNPGNPWMRWTSRYHVDCLFGQNGRAATIRFNEGFSLPLTSGIKVGSSEREVLSAYGVPDSVVQQPESKEFIYYKRGVLMWVTDGKVFSFTVLEHPAAPSLIGIGAALKKNEDRFVVVKVFAGSPAESAGLQSGDELRQIDGQPLKGDLQEVVRSLAGKVDTVVKINVRKKDGTEVELAIPRRPIHFP